MIGKSEGHEATSFKVGLGFERNRFVDSKDVCFNVVEVNKPFIVIVPKSVVVLLSDGEGLIEEVSINRILDFGRQGQFDKVGLILGVVGDIVEECRVI